MPGTFGYTQATNIVVVTGGTSGSPADFASFVAADRAGTLTLLNAGVIDASPDTFSLTTAIRPVEKRVIKITISTSVDRVGATANVAGTDGDGDAISEGLDIATAHSTPVTTVLKYAAMNASGLTITGMTNGDTVTVTQPQWGVIWNLGGSISVGIETSHSYRLDCKFNIGDGSTATYFQDSKKVIILSDGIVSGTVQTFISVTANATFHLGNLIDATVRSTSDGCHIHLEEVDYYGTGISVCTSNTALVLFYSCSFSAMKYRRGYLTLQGTGSHRVWNCLMMHDIVLSGVGTNIDIYNLTTCYSTYIAMWPSGTWNKIQGFKTDQAIYADGASTYSISNLISVTVNNFIVAWGFQGTVNIIDTISSSWTQSWGGSNNTGQFLRKYTCNIHIADKDGNNLSGVTVLCEDKDGTDIFSVTTAADGTIIEQQITYIRYYYSGGALNYTYSPHKFTISKAGYQTLVLENITVDHPIVWHLELQQPQWGGAAYKNIGIGVNA